MTGLKYRGLVFFFVIPQLMIDAAQAHEKELMQWIWFKYYPGELIKNTMILLANDKHPMVFSFESQFSEN